MKSPIRFVLGQLWSILGMILAFVPGTSYVGTLWGKLGGKLRRKPTRQQTTYEWVLSFFAFFIIVLFLIALVGCKDNPVKTANSIRDDIHDKTAEIIGATTRATANVEKADHKVTTATTQPGVPQATVALLNGAHGDLTNAKGDLAKIAPAAQVVDTKADDAAKVTEKVSDENTKIKSGWGYRLQKWVHNIFWGFIVLAPILGILAFVIKTNGGGPILSAIGEVLGNLISVAWAVIKFVGKWTWAAVYHVSTLGMAKMADITNKHYDKKQEQIRSGYTVQNWK